jgi:hypothetical protein
MGDMSENILEAVWGSNITPITAFLAQSATFVWLTLSGHLVTRRQHERELKQAVARGNDFKAAIDKQDALIAQKDATIAEKDRQIARLIEAQHATASAITPGGGA